MKLLVVTQKVNENDSNLGFFQEWLKKIAAQVEHVYVICLEKGEYHLPANLTVLSLGKEEKFSRIQYLIRFYKYIWKYRKEYDGVFVHMNPEYAILGGWLWRLWNKKILLWYVHKSVNFKLWLAEKLVSKIFTASKESFRLSSKKFEVTGHGIDILKYQQDTVTSPRRDLLFAVGRISPSKDWETVIKGLSDLKNRNTVPSPMLDIAGAPITNTDFEYFKKLQLLFGDVAYKTYKSEEMPRQYRMHYLLIHTSRTGSMDKVVLEALAAGRLVVSSSEAYADLAEGELKGVLFHFPPGDYKELANTIEKIYQSGIILPSQKAVEYVRRNHNLDTLIGKIVGYFTV